MLKRLGKTITNNFSLKILAVILAVVLWVVVINIDDPTTSRKSRNWYRSPRNVWRSV